MVEATITFTLSPVRATALPMLVGVVVNTPDWFVKSLILFFCDWDELAVDWDVALFVFHDNNPHRLKIFGPVLK
jgi:hypothetical protein